MADEQPTAGARRRRAEPTAPPLTGNHGGIAVLLFVAVFVGAETLHVAQVALSQELVGGSRDGAHQKAVHQMMMDAGLIHSPDASQPKPSLVT